MTENSRGRPWAVWAVVAVWTVCFCLDLSLDVSGTLAGQGIHALNGQYYRLFSGLLLHSGFLHLAVNCMAMYWACQVLMPILGSGKLLLFALAAGCGAQAAFLLLLAPDAAYSVGGSPLVFALIGLLIPLRLLRPEASHRVLGSWCGRLLLYYGVLANVPVLPGMDISTLALHLMALALGVAAGWAALGCGVL